MHGVVLVELETICKCVNLRDKLVVKTLVLNLNMVLVY